MLKFVLRLLPCVAVLALCAPLTPTSAAPSRAKNKIVVVPVAKHGAAAHARGRPIAVRPRGRRDPPGTLPGFGRGDVYDQRIAARRTRARPNAFAYTLPAFYDWDGARYYPGRPGFYRGQWNGGSFGPCYTQTPIGPVNNCGQ